MSPPSLLNFGPFRIDLANETLWRGQTRLPLKPKSFAVLRSLMERAQQLVTKDQLLEAHWGEVAVGDAVLKTCIGEIRQVLGEHAHAPQCIETVHRRGYRFLVMPTPTTQATRQSEVRAFVGRMEELEQLHQWWERAKQGARQIIFVTGEPGIGKTTLVDTFLQHVTASGEVWIGRGHCIEQYGAGEAYLPILEALGRLCRQSGGETLVACLRQYAPTWLMHLPGLLDPAEIPQLLPTVMGATPVRMMRELADALEEFTREQAVILSVEDLHWLDASSLELLTYIARRSNPARLLVVGTYRPADLILHEHPLKQTKQELLIHGQCQELRVECLTEGAVEEFLMQRFAEGDPASVSVHALAQVIHQRTEGNPLFLVNVVDYLVSHDLIVQKNQEWQLKNDRTATLIPIGLRQFIDVRIEQLDSEDRHLLVTASVAGMTFTTATLAAVLETPMADIDSRGHALVQRDQFIRSLDTSPWPDGTLSAQYAFQHALYQEALYQQTSMAQRMELHRKIGERLEQGYSERTRVIAAELALHFERGHEPDRASLYHQQAGEDAFKRSGYQEAIFHLTKALQFLQTLPPGPARDQRELGLQSLLGVQFLQIKNYGSSEAWQAFNRAWTLCRHLPKSLNLFPILFGLVRFYSARGNNQMVQKISGQLVNLAKKANDPALHLIAYTAKGVPAMHMGDLQAAFEYLKQGLSVTQTEDPMALILKYGEDSGTTTRIFLSWVLGTMGFLDQALDLGEQVLLRAKNIGNPFMLSAALLSLTLCLVMRGDRQKALQMGDETVTLAQKYGFQQWLSEGLVLRGSTKAMLGKTQEGWSEIEQGLALQGQMGSIVSQPNLMAFPGDAALEVGYYQQGLKMMEEWLDFMNETGYRRYEAELTRQKGELILALGEPDKKQAREEAERCFQDAIQISRKQEAKTFELRAMMSLSRLWQQQGKGKQARPQLRKIYNWFTEGFATKDLQDAKAMLENLK